MYRRDFMSLWAASVAVSLAGGAAEAGARIPLDGAIRLFAEARQGAGLVVPMPEAGLAETARRQVLLMAARGVASHLGAGGEAPDLRARQAGFSGQVLGEALAETWEGPEATMAFWLSHGATREVLMEASVNRFGLAAATGADGRAWWLLAAGAAQAA